MVVQSVINEPQKKPWYTLIEKREMQFRTCLEKCRRNFIWKMQRCQNPVSFVGSF